MNCNRFTNRIYYTLKDFLKTIDTQANNPLYFDNQGNNFATIYKALYNNPTIKADTNAMLTSNEAKTLLCKHIIIKNYNMVCAYEDIGIQESIPEMTSDHRIEVFEEFVINLIMVFLSTYDRYKKILDSYAAKENELLGQISSINTNKTRFNDTPQDSDETFFDDDEHATNVQINEAESKTDGNTPMQRLEEIRSLYANVYAEWCNEFDSLFIVGE